MRSLLGADGRASLYCEAVDKTTDKTAQFAGHGHEQARYCA